ncbi:hypothetical protein [Allokutzneria albata]|uniref:Integral membrane protein n=1 Tax=Allokutzneria albata TaxID=211114 RepID=A0A1H0CY96_ALLAB|nr:hypothetical protein [Allokutzneria albata]SDN62872.1 hypothetical protein SAMN04489726_7484 [Allokutzneria albata]
MQKRSRQLLIWLHVITSVGWMSLALVLFALITFGLSTDVPGMRDSASAMAHLLDEQVLAHLANAAAFTGFMLSALTQWGYFRHWWVLIKFVITVVQLAFGIFVLAPTVAGINVVVTLLMFSAIAFQAWLSVAKPGTRTPWTPPGRLPPGPASMYIVSLVVPVVDFAVGFGLFGHPMPVLSLLVAVGYPLIANR